MKNKSQSYSNSTSSKSLNLNSYFNVLAILKGEGSEEEFISHLYHLINLIRTENQSDLQDKKNRISLIIYCIRGSGYLFQMSSETKYIIIYLDEFGRGIEFLEFARDLIPDNVEENSEYEKLKICIYNNLATYSLQLEDGESCRKYLLSCLKRDKGSNKFLSAIFYNNISSFYLMKSSIDKVFKYSKKAIEKTEEEIQRFMSMVSEDLLAVNVQFQKRISVYILAKLNFAFSVEREPAIAEGDETIPDPLDQYTECYNLCFKFLGPEHLLTEKALNGVKRLKPKFKIIQIDSMGSKIVKHIRTSSHQTNSNKTPVKNLYSLPQTPQLLHPNSQSIHVLSKSDKNSPQYSSFKESKQKEFIIRNSSISTGSHKEKGTSKTEADEPLSHEKKQEPLILSNVVKARVKKLQPTNVEIQGSERKTASDQEKKEKQNLILASLNQTAAEMQKQFEDNFPKIFELLMQEKDKLKSPSTSKIAAEVAQQASKIKELEIKLLQSEKEKNERGKKDLEFTLEKLKQNMPRVPQEGSRVNEPIRTQETTPKVSHNSGAKSIPIIDTQVTSPKANFQDNKGRESTPVSLHHEPKPNPPKIEHFPTEVTISNLRPNNNLKLVEVNQPIVFNATGKEDPFHMTVMTYKTYIKSQKSEESHLSGATADGSIKNFGNGRIPSTEFELLNTSRANSLEIERCLITKKKIILDNNQTYWLVCKAYLQENEKYFKLEVLSNNNKKITDEELKYSEYKWIVERCEYKDVMPVGYDKKHLKQCKDYIKYLIMPFVQIEIDQESTQNNIKMEINFSAKSRGLFTGLNSIDFLDKKCIITFHHVIANIFRVVLTENSAYINRFVFNFRGEDVLRIDLEFEKLEEFFSKIGGNQDLNSNFEPATRIITGFDENSDETELEEAASLVKTILEDNLAEVELDNFVIKNDTLYNKIHGLLKEIEDFFIGVGYRQFNQISDEKIAKYLKVKIGIEMKKATLHFVIDNVTENTFNIYQQNFHETFAPKGAKIKAGGKYVYKYSVFQKFFGLSFSDLDGDEKIGAISLLSDAVTLKTFDKQLTEEDNEKFSDNPIMVVPIEIGCYQRSYLTDRAKIPTPLTISLVGIKGKPFGIKATTYNRNDVKESGVFFFIDPSYWVKKIDPKVKSKSLKIETSALLENFYLDYILKKGGWDIIKDALVIGNAAQKIEVLGIKATKGYGNTDQLENIINNEAIAKYYKFKEQIET